MSAISTVLLKNTVEPTYNRHFLGEWDSHEQEWNQYFDSIKGEEKSSHQEPLISGFGEAVLKGEGEAVARDTAGEVGLATYVYEVYALSFEITEEAIEDGKEIQVGSLFSRHLARSMLSTKEQVCANTLNRAFSTSYNGWDAKPLCSTTHPGAFGGPVISNRLAADTNLSEAGLEQIRQDIRTAKDVRGLPISIRGKKLLVHPANGPTAVRLLESQLRPGTAMNDVNALKFMGFLPDGFLEITRLSSATAWFVKTNAPQGLQHIERVGMKKGMEGDFETGGVRYKARMRFSVGWTNPQGVYGTPGV